MVILVEKLKFGHRLEKHEPQEALRASFQAFRSDVSQALVQILGDGKAGSLSWIQRCLEKFLMIEMAFAKLAVDADYPMTKWGASVSEAYLNYSLNVLELVNKMSSSISHLSQARLSLSHQLSLLTISDSNSKSINLNRRIKPKDIGNSFHLKKTGKPSFGIGYSREWVIHEALAIMTSTGLQLLWVMLSGLCGDPWPYAEVRKSGGDPPPLKGLEHLESGLRELEEVNDAAAKLTVPTKDDAKMLATKLDTLEKVLQATGNQADGLFSQVLAARTKFLDTIRLKW